MTRRTPPPPTRVRPGSPRNAQGERRDPTPRDERATPQDVPRHDGWTYHERLHDHNGKWINNPKGYPRGSHITCTGLLVAGPIHMAARGPHDEDGVTTVAATCGIEGKRYIFHDATGGIRVTYWAKDVTCLACRAMLPDE